MVLSGSPRRKTGQPSRKRPEMPTNLATNAPPPQSCRYMCRHIRQSVVRGAVGLHPLPEARRGRAYGDKLYVRVDDRFPTSGTFLLSAPGSTYKATSLARTFDVACCLNRAH